MKNPNKFALVGMFLAAAAAMVSGRNEPDGRSGKRRSDGPRRRGWSSPHQGPRERARRVRQMAAGQLRDRFGLDGARA